MLLVSLGHMREAHSVFELGDYQAVALQGFSLSSLFGAPCAHDQRHGGVRTIINVLTTSRPGWHDGSGVATWHTGGVLATGCARTARR